MHWIFSSLLFLFALPLCAQTEVSFLEAKPRAFALNEPTFTDAIRLPFERVGGMLILKASMDGVSGNYILDTGAPGLIINGTPNDSDDLVEGMGIGGEVAIEAITVANFELGELTRKNLSAYRLDMGHLEQAANLSIAGLIGYEVLRDLELFIDIEEGVLLLFSAKNSPLTQLIGEPLLEMPFVLRNHLPVVKMKIGKRTLRMGFDTGAEVNLLNERLFEKLEPHREGFVYRHRVRGLDQSISEVLSCHMNGATLEKHKLITQEYYYTDLTAIRQMHQLSIDGLLGYPFLRQYRVSINYQSERISIWEK